MSSHFKTDERSEWGPRLNSYLGHVRAYAPSICSLSCRLLSGCGVSTTDYSETNLRPFGRCVPDSEFFRRFALYSYSKPKGISVGDVCGAQTRGGEVRCRCPC